MTTSTAPLSAAMTVGHPNGHTFPVTHTPIAQPQPPQPAPHRAPQRVLGDSPGERRIVAIIGSSVLALALTGMYVSFRTVYAYVLPYFHGTAWAVPSGVDLAILVFSAADLMLMYWDIPMPGLRLVPWAFTAATIALNWQSGGPLPIRIAHAAMPSLWVVFCEYARHVIRHRVGLVAGTRMEKIRKSRWLLAPWSTARMWRRMILWEVTDYRQALVIERRRLGAVAAARQAYDHRWRSRVGGLLRLEIDTGEVGADQVTAAIRAHQSARADRADRVIAGTDPTDPTRSDPTDRPDPTRSGQPTRPDSAGRPDRIRPSWVRTHRSRRPFTPAVRPDPIGQTRLDPPAPEPTVPTGSDRTDRTDRIRPSWVHHRPARHWPGRLTRADRPRPTDPTRLALPDRPSRPTQPTASVAGGSRAVQAALARLPEVRRALGDRHPTEPAVREILHCGSKAARAVRDALKADPAGTGRTS